MIRKKTLCILLAVCMVMCFVPQVSYGTADQTGSFRVTGGTYGADYSYSDETGAEVLTVLSDTPLTISTG